MESTFRMILESDLVRTANYGQGELCLKETSESWRQSVFLSWMTLRHGAVPFAQFSMNTWTGHLSAKVRTAWMQFGRVKNCNLTWFCWTSGFRISTVWKPRARS